MKILVALLALVVIAGCHTTSIHMSHVTMTPDGQLIEESKMDITSVPREWKDVYFQGYNVTLRAGAAAVAENPWADVVGDVGKQVIQEAVCVQNPLLKRCIKGD